MKSIIYLILICLSLVEISFSNEFFSLEDCREKGCSDQIFKNKFILENGEYFDYSYPNLIIEKKGYDGDLDTVNEDTSMEFNSQEVRELLKLATILSLNTNLANDKEKHLKVGATIGYLSGKACQIGRVDTYIRLSERQTHFLCSFGAATLAGVLKEVYDSTGRGNVEVADAFVTSVGGLTMSFKF